MRKNLIIVVLFILICALIFVSIQYQDKKVKKEFELFYSSKLSGKIVKIYEYSRGSNFILDKSPTKFSFYPYVDKDLNNSEIFEYIAKPGDSIYKASYSDTLFLIKKDKTYVYTFRKFK